MALHIHNNKLCTMGASLRRRGFDVTCPGHDNCTAALTADENLSEFDIGKDIGNECCSQNVAVRYVVTEEYGSVYLLQECFCRLFVMNASIQLIKSFLMLKLFNLLISLLCGTVLKAF